MLIVQFNFTDSRWRISKKGFKNSKSKKLIGLLLSNDVRKEKIFLNK